MPAWNVTFPLTTPTGAVRTGVSDAAAAAAITDMASSSRMVATAILILIFYSPFVLSFFFSDVGVGVPCSVIRVCRAIRS